MLVNVKQLKVEPLVFEDTRNSLGQPAFFCLKNNEVHYAYARKNQKIHCDTSQDSKAHEKTERLNWTFTTVDQ